MHGFSPWPSSPCWRLLRCARRPGRRHEAGSTDNPCAARLTSCPSNRKMKLHFLPVGLAARPRRGYFLGAHAARTPAQALHAFLTAEEKGIDVRIAIDVIRLAHRAQYDVAVVFSQDQDLSELCREVRVIAKEQDRWIKIACAFPVSPTTKNRRGLAHSDWIKIDRTMYEACVDPRDYRPKRAGTS